MYNYRFIVSEKKKDIGKVWGINFCVFESSFWSVFFCLFYIFFVIDVNKFF